MKKNAKRCLALMLSIIMVFTMIPVSSYAAQTQGTYVKINGAAELTSGKYVMVEGAGKAAGELSGNTLNAVSPTVVGDKVFNPDSSSLWTITVSGDTVILADNNGKKVKPTGSSNAFAEGEFSWTVVNNSDGTISFTGLGYTIGFNSTVNSNAGGFRPYKTASSTVTLCKFTLYKYDSNAPVVPMKAVAPQANKVSGTVVSGSAITFSSVTPNAKIQYTTASPAAIWVDYTNPITIESDTTFYAKATATGYEESDISTFIYTVVPDTEKPTITMPTFENAETGKDYKISVTITDNAAVTGAALTYKVNSIDKQVTMIQSTTDKTKWEVTIPGSALVSGISKFSVLVNATDNAGNVATSDEKEILVADKPQITAVTPIHNSKLGDVKNPLISVSAINLGTSPTAKLTLKVGETVKLDAVSMSYANGTFSYTPSENLADARYTASVVITRADGITTSNEWSFTVGTPNYSLYFGQLHSHTTFSDGSGSLDDALAYINNISDSDNIDFVAFTDHSNYFDKTKTDPGINPEASLYNKSLMTAESQTLWNEYKTKIANFNASKTNRGVIALGGFEMTWSGGPGHINTWNTAGIVSRNNTTLNNKTNDAGMKAYYSLLSQAEGATSISEFNHPGTTFGTFSDFAYWDPTIDSRMALVEVGNGEGAIGSGGYFPSYNYYTMALDKGWHLAPTNNQDNHKGKWGNANDARDVIITDDFTEQGIYDALKAHRVYATEDKNLEITYTVNDELMGTIIKEVPEQLNLNVTLKEIKDDTDPSKIDTIEKAEVIANSGRVVYTWDVNALSKELSTTLKPDYSYYYIRVTEKDGDIAVTAPVWVGNAKKLGITNVEGSTATPVTNEKMTIKTTLFNNEATDATVKSLTYKLDGTIIDTKTETTVIAKEANTTISYDFTPTRAKVQTISVEAILTVDGKDFSFTKDLSLDVRDSNKLVYVGIDGSHYNEYVTGNYKDSMGNFSNLAAESNVRCVVLNTSDDLLAAAKNADGKYKMLILTAPSRRLAAAVADPKVYSDTEIAAIKGFSEAGGSVVLCGWSDLYENYTGVKDLPADSHMAGQQNKLLAALGSSMRISDDATWDDVSSAYKPTDKNDNNKARLYLSAYNWDNALTKGIVYDDKHKMSYDDDKIYTQFFSQYGGSSIYTVDKDGKATSTLPSTVSPVVYTYSTTISKDNDNDLGSLVIPKYKYTDGSDRLMVMASENVTHANGTKSLVIADGAAFMSNFEIKATVGDTNAELNYSNYTILQNLIQYVNPTGIDTIASVQKEPEEGVKFTVEGIVTSNASGYDKDTAFFDCIYLQDGTSGINAFPVAGNYKVGQKVRVTGTTSSYQGERQLNVSKISLVDSDVTTVTPKVVTAEQINNKSYLGSLVKISGTVEKVELANGAVQTIMVKDVDGNVARVFIDGYITTSKEIKNLVVGNLITAVGLSSYDNTFVGQAARIRVRDRADIVCTANNSMPAPVVTTPPVTPAPDGGTTVTVDKAVTTVTDGKANVKVEISEKALADTVKDGNGKVTISLGKEALKDTLADTQVKKGVVIDLAIPTVKDATVNNIVLSTDALLLAKEAGQKLTINVANADATGYTVSIPASELKKVTDASKDLNLAVALEKDTKVATKSIGVLTVGTEGALATGMVVTVPVKDTLSVSAGNNVYVYIKDAKTGALVEVPNNKLTVADDGSLKLSTLSGGDFVICTAKAKDAVKLVDKVTVEVKSSVAKGDTVNVKASLPQELAKVTAFTKGDPIGQEEAKVTYKISDKAIATVSSDGSVNAKKKGTVTLTVVVTLENGQKKSFTKEIKVK